MRSDDENAGLKSPAPLASTPRLNSLPPAAAASSPLGFSDLCAKASPLNRAPLKSLTAWGYVYTSEELAPGSGGPSTGGSSAAASWTTVRAGLLSPPPPLTASQLLSPSCDTRGHTEASTVASAAGDAELYADRVSTDTSGLAERLIGAGGRGGWLVDLVDWVGAVSLDATPDAAQRAQPDAPQRALAAGCESPDRMS